MKLSLKLEDQQQTQTPILFKAKIPIAVFGLPFLSGFSATHHDASPAADNLSLSLRTHFPSGPSLKLSYNTATSSAAAGAAAAPFTLTLKSGVSLYGSPNNSPLIISANFSFSPQNPNPNPNPNFTIQFKPKLGSFSFRKSISSTISNPSKKLNGEGDGNGENSYGFVQLDRPNIWKDWTVESATKGPILSGILMAADTELPVTKRVKVNLRWGVSIPSEYEKQLPYLRVNKIKVERVVNEENENQKQGIDWYFANSGEFDMLKGMCSWMTRELNDLQKENREMRRTLEEIKSRQPLRNQNGYNGGGGGGGKRAVLPVVESSDGFEQWRMRKNSGGSEANVQRETKKNGGSTDVESELQKAIKAASSS